ncbi:MAG TPA: Rieske 2Fe-2S domain-containing protein [Bryobacteraceae bacterium]|nr:Rieske 2Fe-2S domain-containing protein [Bryobacteraceae bacterium]
MAAKVVICASAAVAEGGRLVVDVGERTIGVFRVRDKLYAYENSCPHQGGPVCQGAILPRVVEQLNEDRESQGFDFHPRDLHIVCPWHGFEFNIETGCHPASPAMRLSPVPVAEDEGLVHVTI